MLDIEILMEELEDETKMHPPPERKRQVEKILDDHDPNVLVELAEAPEDIQERIRELDDEKDSPRGRLYLMRGLWEGELKLNSSSGT